ncbi:MAG: ATP-dependent DNA helicase [Ktedonobacteraceae bacterium]
MRNLSTDLSLERNAVLFGLKSFWEGVDIPGEALSLVVIDRLPFPPPDDPIHTARAAQIQEQGGDGFYGYALPQMVILLKQGAGRLIRTDNDRGVIVILDTRLLNRSYGKSILGALPPSPLVTHIKKVERFFALLGGNPFPLSKKSP